jgi:hypothetical protein
MEIESPSATYTSEAPGSELVMGEACPSQRGRTPRGLVEPSAANLSTICRDQSNAKEFCRAADPDVTAARAYGGEYPAE